MKRTMDEITSFSPCGGRLVLEEVKGKQANAYVPENTIQVKDGKTRDMYVYLPLSGCPDAKQTQVLIFLREGSDEKSAQDAMKKYQLDSIAEENNLILVFSNPLEGGWNFSASEDKEDDVAFFSRCFMTLPTTKARIGGFIGMIFYMADTPKSSAMALTVSALAPLHTAGVMISDVPEDYAIPGNHANAPQVAYICSSNAQVLTHFEKVNGVSAKEAVQQDNTLVFTSRSNPNIRHIVSGRPFSAQEAAFAWDTLFSHTRRWSNDIYGTYQARTDFAARGFVPHVNDTSLGVNGGHAHTWYEYVPPQLRAGGKKVPLLFYFHGIGCVPLYGAEQSGWHDIADREDFIVVYPKPAQNKAWNIWDDPAMLSDHSFVLALLEHMKKTYPIDETRIYISGFSMGGMMTNALASSYPDIFAAAAPCNGFHMGYVSPPVQAWPGFIKMFPNMHLPEYASLSEIPPTRIYSDEKKAQYDYRMPIIQNTGLLDGQWPIKDKDPYNCLASFDYWKKYNNIPLTPYTPYSGYESGLHADETFYSGEDKRFLHHRWFGNEKDSPVLYEAVLAKRMPHAVDLRQLEIAWAFIKKFSRQKDGSLVCAP